MILIKPKYIPYLVAGVYFLISILVLSSFIGILDADYYSYMSIARKYRAGEWYYALNDYWSPLISWLMALGYFVTSNEMLDIKLLKVLFGTIGLFYTYKIINLFGIRYKAIFIIIFSLLLFFYQFQSQTADNLSLMMLIVFVHFNIANKGRFDRVFTLKYSLLTLFSFFSKYYNLYFIFLFTPILFLYKNDFNIRSLFTTGKVLSIIKVYVLTSIFISGWVLLNYSKTHQFTITSSAAYNLELMNPKNHKQHPFYYSDLKELPDKYSFSPLDYFPYKANLESFSFFSSKKNISFFWWYEKGQIKNFFQWIFIETAALIFLLIVCYLLNIQLDVKSLIFILSFAFIYPAGYFLSFLVPRYIMITNYLILLGISVLLNSLFINIKLKISLPVTVGICSLISYFYIVGICNLTLHNGAYKQFTEESKKYTGDIFNTNVAVYSNGIAGRLWSEGLAMAYLYNAKFYGQVNIKNYKNNADLTRKLLAYNINIYLSPKEILLCPDSMNYKLMGIAKDVKIFKRINKSQN